MRTLFLCLSLAVVSSACGGGEPEAEATWETNTTAPDDTAGGDEADDGSGDQAGDAPSTDASTDASTETTADSAAE